MRTMENRHKLVHTVGSQMQLKMCRATRLTISIGKILLHEIGKIDIFELILIVRKKKKLLI